MSFSIELTATILSGAASVLAGAVSYVVKERLFERKTLIAVNSAPPEEDKKEMVRLYEARNLLERQENFASWNKVSSNLLTFSQYVVGGILASSFIQENLSSQVIGAIGVIVLLASLIHQRFRPDAAAIGAKKRVIRLKSIIRKAEDMLFDLEQSEDGASTVSEIRKFVSDGIEQIESSELVDFTSKEKSNKTVHSTSRTRRE